MRLFLALLCLPALAGCPGNTSTYDPCQLTHCDGSTPPGDSAGGPDKQVIPKDCGNNKKEPGEECDDGNKDNTDACLNNCMLAFCGDGHVRKGVEQCDDGNEVDSDACSNTCQSRDFQANAVTAGDQRAPAVAAASDGTLLVVWQDASTAGADKSGTTVRLRRFSAGGKPLDPVELVAPTTMTKDQRDPDIAVNGQDQALVAWTDWSATGGGPNDVRGRLVGKAGALSGGDFMINSTTKGPQAAPAVAALADNSFWVAFNDTSIGGSSHGTDSRVRRVSAGGQPVGSDFRVNTTDQGDQIWPDLAQLPGGNMLVVWRNFSSKSPIGDSFGIAYRTFSLAGKALGSEARVNQSTTDYQDNPSVAVTSSGVLVAWDSGLGGTTGNSSVGMRWLSSSGKPTGGDLKPFTSAAGNKAHPAVAGRGGAIALAWEDHSLAATQGMDIRGRRYSGQTAVDKADLLVNTTVKVDQARPAVAVMPGGRVAVVWESTYGEGGTTYGIRMRILPTP